MRCCRWCHQQIHLIFRLISKTALYFRQRALYFRKRALYFRFETGLEMDQNMKMRAVHEVLQMVSPTGTTKSVKRVHLTFYLKFYKALCLAFNSSKRALYHCKRASHMLSKYVLCMRCCRQFCRQVIIFNRALYFPKTPTFPQKSPAFLF